jgi:hypothetical protein
MRFQPQIRISVTRRGEKDERLGAFIARSLVAAGQSAEAQRRGGICVIARSVESPVSRAIGALAKNIAAAGHSVRMILVKPGRLPPPGGFAEAHAAALDCEVRLARDPRLIEAHEQLVLGHRTCWMGDSMRRDPAASDAYESFVDDCAELAAAAQATFERLWLAAEPLFAHAPLGPARASQAEGRSADRT